MIQCTFENGAKASLRHVTMVALLTNDKNQILLTRRAPDLLGGNKWAIPGGFLNRDETTEEGVLREVLEETGLKGKDPILFRINTNRRRKEERQNVDFVYIIKDLQGTPILNNEVTEIGWFDKDKLPSENEFAFDHRDSIALYFTYVEKQFQLPLVS